MSSAPAQTASPLSTSPSEQLTPSLSSPALSSMSSRHTTIFIEEIQGKNINEKDVFIKFNIDGKKHKTKVHRKTANPLWSDKFTILDEIVFTLVSQTVFGNNVDIGRAKFPIVRSSKETTATISASPTLLKADVGASNGNNHPLSSSSGSTSTSTSVSDETMESWTIDTWMPLERSAVSHASVGAEIKVRMLVKVRDLFIDSIDSGASVPGEEGVTSPVPPSRNFARAPLDPKELSLIGKGGSQIKRFTKKITAKIEKNANSNRKDAQQAMIDDALARERAKELEREALDKEKQRAREKLRQREEEEQQKQMDKERQEERRKAKEAKQKKDKEKRYVPTRPIDHFFVVGCSSKLDPIDQRYDFSGKSSDPLDIVYKGELLDCYPPKDDDILPNHIWMYCFPRGVTLQTEEQAPSFFPFVMTNEVGGRFYVSCLTFYEPVSEEMASELRKKRNSMNPIISVSEPGTEVGSGAEGSASNSGADKSKRISMPPNTQQTQNTGAAPSTSQSIAVSGGGNSGRLDTIYAPKCICFLSHYPFHSFFRICLNEIYQKVFFSTSPIPIERWIYNMVQEVPLPIPGINSITYTLNNSSLSLKRPAECLLPMTDCLDIKNVLLLFKCILLEEKIVIISAQYSLLTYIAEILSNLLHPFTWPHVFVPILPELLLEYVYSPFPFIMGIHKSYSHNILNEENLLSEIVVVDLDNNNVFVPSQQDVQARSVSLPEKETTQLVYQLRKVVQYELLSADLPNFNLNTLSPIASSSDSKRMLSNQHHTSSALIPPSQSTIDEHIRLSFLQFFCNIMADYRKSLKYLRVFPKPITLFNKPEFIKTRSSSSDYKKPIEEMTVLYQTQIPQALGVLETSKHSTVVPPAPSSLRNTATSIREYSRFPTLKPEYMVAAPASTSYRTPSSAQPNPPISSPPFEIYSVSSEDASSNPVPNPLDALELGAEEQLTSFVSIVELFFSKMALDVTPEPSDTQQILELLKFDNGRQIFAKLLLGYHHRATEPNRARLSDALFVCLGDILKAALREANLHSDFATTRMYLEAAFIYHRLQKGSNEFVSERVRNQDIWQNYKFWEQFFFDSIESRCKAMYGNNVVRELIKWSSYTPEKQDRLKVEERDMEFSLLSKMVYYMINLGSQPDLVRRFVNKMCSGISFDSERTETMMQVVSNITRARDMYDMDDDIDTSDDTNHIRNNGDGHVTKDVKMHEFTKDTYLPIGLQTAASNEGRELLTHLIHEKSSSVVALRSISRIMNLKSAWTEKRSKTSNKIDYRDISENRGDYVIKTFTGHQEGVLCLALATQAHKESSTLVTGSADSTLKVWDVTSTKCLGTLEGHGGWVTSCEIGPDAKIISGSYDKTLKLWDLNKCTKIKSFRGHKGGSCDGRVKVWSVETGECIKTLQGHSGSVNSLLLHSKTDGDNHMTRKFITASADSSIQVWDSNYAESYHTLTGHTDEVMNVSKFVNNLVVSGSFDGTVKLWDIENGKSQRTIHNHQHRISSLKTYESLIVTGSWDKTAKACLFSLDFRA
eukprot:gene13717-16171_t